MTDFSSTQMRVAVSVNLIGAIIATVGIVLYAIDLGAVSVVWICRSYREDKNNCLKVASIAQVSLFDDFFVDLTKLFLCSFIKQRSIKADVIFSGTVPKPHSCHPMHQLDINPLIPNISPDTKLSKSCVISIHLKQSIINTF